LIVNHTVKRKVTVLSVKVVTGLYTAGNIRLHPPSSLFYAQVIIGVID
jgi:hypothetical protein